jgi:hypothetical protein
MLRTNFESDEELTLSSSVVTPSESASQSISVISSTFHESGKKRSNHSDVWNFIDRASMKCNNCAAVFSDKSSTSTIRHHLRSCNGRFKQTTLNIRRISEEQKLERNEKLVNFILTSLSPFSIVENLSFIEYVKSLDPQATLPSRRALVNQIDDLFFKMKSNLIKILGNNESKICWTCDGWTSVNNDPFFAVTCHFIDDHWTLKESVLSLSVLKHPHDSITIAERLKDVASEYCIMDKIFCITTDNASNMINCVPLFKNDCHHFRCMAHILNLVAKTGLNHLQQELKVIRGVVLSIKRYSSLNQKLELACELSSTKYLKPILDVDTRWNSTYDMLERALYLKMPIKYLCSQDLSLKELLIDDWYKIESIVSLLKPLKEVTVELSASKVITVGECFGAIIFLENHFSIHEHEFPAPVSDMRAKLLTFMNKQSLFFIGCCMLDPRVKNSLFPDKAAAKKFLQDALDQDYPSFETPSLNTGGFLSKITHKVLLSELDDYLNEPICSSEVNVLQWWKLNERRFSRLSKMARDYLSVMPTSTASERSFSLSGRVISKIRNRLTPDNSEKSILLNTWINKE